MSFCKFSSQAIINGKTEVDNIFINDFLPYAPENAVKVYLYGLYKCNSPSAYDNSIEGFSKVLKIPQEEIMDIFEFWESEGLVQILNTIPVEIRFMPIKNVLNNTKKFNVSKYGDFAKKAQEIIEGRMISTNEYNEYFDTIEVFHIEPEALLMIMKYCVNTKGANVGYSYIIAVAKNWAYDGVKTVGDVEERLISYEQSGEEMRLVLKALGSKKVPSIEEKELYFKWTKDLGFELGIILKVVELNKKTTAKLSFNRLDEILMSYYEMKLMSISEIQEFETNKKQMLSLAKRVAKELGLYYENYDKIVETYVSKWLAKGFSEKAIEKIASYCFSCSIRKFEGMDEILQKFFKLGLLSVQSLEKYFSEVLLQDEKIKKILSVSGADRAVNSFDRELYRNWTANWNFPTDVIEYGASLSAEKSQPMRYLNGILARWNECGAKTLEEAKKQGFSSEKKVENVKSRNYSKENLNALFDSLEEVEI